MALVLQPTAPGEALGTLATAGHPSTVIGHVETRAPSGAGVVIS